tara:strand:+ start:895 stop:1041 length:147 start_codon:yes stop_codon:yes gene_type:complete
MSDLDLDERYYLIAYTATKQAEEYGYQTGFENRMHHFEGAEGMKGEEV